MQKLTLAMISAALMCGCNAAKPATPVPQPPPIPVAEQWTVTVTNPPPTGWTLQPQTVLVAQTIPVGPCSTDFTNLMSPNMMWWSLNSEKVQKKIKAKSAQRSVKIAQSLH